MASEIKKFYEFGKFSFDAQRLRLEHDGTPVQLPPKSLEALKVLLEEKGRTVSRENFLEKIWSESFVEDANLTVAVSTLRKTLSAYESENFIQTVPRKGYRFVGDAQEKIEISEQPIIVERHAVEHLTIEKNAAPTLTAKTFPRAYLALAAALGLIIAVGAFWFWQRGEKAAAFNPSDNNEANEAFARGDALMQKRATVCDSISYFREALAKDETHARAHAGLAAALAMCGDPNKEADSLVAKSLALDPNLAEAYATDGFIKMFVHWNWDGAENSLRRAVALNPNSAKSHHWLGVALSIRGRFLEAAGEMRRAIEIEPDSPLYRADLCQIHYFEKHIARAVTECQKAEELDPNFLFTAKYLRDIYLLAGDELKAWEYDAKQKLISQHAPETIKAEEEIFRREGFKGLYRGGIRFHTEQLKNANAENRHYHTLGLTENYTLLGDRKNALHWLEQSFPDDGVKRSYPFGVAYIAVDPRNAFLRDDPRFQVILRKMNLAN
jgi:DNA-binding winged helix-turn-helix (wHTH) protein/Flp pilus assembly protein TadD